jgi:hypothetical protein
MNISKSVIKVPHLLVKNHSAKRHLVITCSTNDRVMLVSTKYFSVYSSFLKLKLIVENVGDLRSGKDLGSASRKY